MKANVLFFFLILSGLAIAAHMDIAGERTEAKQYVIDFSSVKALADYLHMLSENDELYREYFAWKRHYMVHLMTTGNLPCQVCAFLNRYHNVTNVIPRLDQVYGRLENCVKPSEYFPQQVFNDIHVASEV